MPFGDRDLLAQHGLLPGGHGGDHPLLVGALHAAADRAADELRGRVHGEARHGVLDGVVSAAAAARELLVELPLDHRLGRRWPLYPGGGAESE